VCAADEEISNMRRELAKYGIDMPAFSKIGGMLAHEVNTRNFEFVAVRAAVMLSSFRVMF